MGKKRPESPLLRDFFRLFLKNIRYESKIKINKHKMKKIREELEKLGITGSEADITDLAHIQFKADVDIIPLYSMKL